MARNGSGTYVLPASNPVQSGTVIESNWANDTMADLAAALTQSIANNGETIPIANLPMGGFRHTNVGDPTARTQYASLGMVQDGRHQRVQVTSGVDNLVGTLVGGATGYVAGAIVSFYAPATNTGVMTLNYNGIGAKSLVSSAGLPLAGGDVLAGAFIMAIYDGNQFVMISQTATSTPSEALTANTTGQERPPSGTFPQMTIATGTTINIPAGSAWIVPPGDGAAVEVSWGQQTITLQYLAASFSTTIAVDDTGTIVQFAGRAIGATLRNYAVLGVVEHINGVANSVITRPAIFADDGYRGTDVASLLTNSLINGGLVTGNAVALMQLDISAGSIFMVGGSANTEDSPNVYTIFQQNNIPFRTLAGQNTLGGALITSAPVTQYDPNGAGTVVTLPNNNDTVIHRLYYMYGSFIWVYGQTIYSSVENALSYIEYDRTKYRPSQFLADAVLVAEIVARKAAASLSLIGDAAIVAPGGINFSIGSPGGISEAPIDGTPYGRQNAAWVQVLKAISPQISTDATITGAAPVLKEVMSPVGAGTAGLNVKQGAFNWFGLEITNPDDKAYFRSYNPANGALRNTVTYDLATGRWTFPEAAFVAAGGSATDTTAGRVLKVGDFGLGGLPPILSGIDVNNVQSAGSTYWCDSCTNTPNGSNGWLVVKPRTVNNFASQEFTEVYGRLWARAIQGGTWQPWVEIWTTDNLVKTTSTLDSTVGRMIKVGDFGIGYPLDLRSTIYSTGVPSDIFGVGTLFGMADGSALGIPGFAANSYGVLTVNSQWSDFSGGWATSRVFLFGQRMFLQGAASASAWQPWVEVATSANSLGHGQTWQTVTGSRALATTYTNTTGRPIEVCVTVYNATGAGSLAANIGGISMDFLQVPMAGCYLSRTFIVPIGATYNFGNGGSSSTLSAWQELR